MKDEYPPTDEETCGEDEEEPPLPKPKVTAKMMTLRQRDNMPYYNK